MPNKLLVIPFSSIRILAAKANMHQIKITIGKTANIIVKNIAKPLLSKK